MTYESWRLTYQDPEQAARAAYDAYVTACGGYYEPSKKSIASAQLQK